MAGPVIRNYKGGSIIYFEKDRAEDIYVLQKGRVVLTYTAIDTGLEMKEDVRLGEFFGVKSAMGHYPREETAQVIGNATVLVFKINEFEALVSKKTNLIIKMLKVFSSQLRQVHRKVREILGEGDARSNSFELMNVAEVFYKNDYVEQAIYAFEKYLDHYPAGIYAGRAKELLNLARKGQQFPVSMPNLVYENEPDAGFSRTANAGTDSIQGQYSKALQLFESGNTAEASSIFQSLLNRTDYKSGSEQTMINNALCQVGKCLFKTGNLDNASSTLTMYIKKNPSGPLVKEAVYYIAQINEKKGDKDKAIAFYTKVIAMPPDDKITTDAKINLGSLKG